jgi:hypothetical protein
MALPLITNIQRQPRPRNQRLPAAHGAEGKVARLRALDDKVCRVEDGARLLRGRNREERQCEKSRHWVFLLLFFSEPAPP